MREGGLWKHSKPKQEQELEKWNLSKQEIAMKYLLKKDDQH